MISPLAQLRWHSLAFDQPSTQRLLRRSVCIAAGTAASTSENAVIIGGRAFTPCTKGARLRDWLLEAGGYVHESLLVVEDAPCGGGRGVVAAQALSVEGGAPLILLPEDLCLTSEVAR
jgi:hypothetical protein